MLAYMVYNKRRLIMNNILKLIIVIIASLSLISMFILPVIVFLSLYYKLLCCKLLFVFAMIFIICGIILNKYDTK